MFLRLGSVAARIRTSNLPLARRTFYPTAPPPRFYAFKNCYIYKKAISLEQCDHISYLIPGNMVIILYY